MYLPRNGGRRGIPQRDAKTTTVVSAAIYLRGYDDEQVAEVVRGIRVLEDIGGDPFQISILPNRVFYNAVMKLKTYLQKSRVIL